jgi:hypothetical protein
MRDYEELSLLAIAGGKAVDQVDFQLGRAIENCLDPNTNPTGTRKVTLSLTIKPEADRTTASVTFVVDSKLQGDAPGVDVCHISRQGKKGYMATARQMDFGEVVDEQTGEVIDLAKQGGGK